MIERFRSLARAFVGALVVLGSVPSATAWTRPFQDTGAAGDESGPTGAPADGQAGEQLGDEGASPEAVPSPLPTAADGIAALVERLESGAPLEALELARSFEARFEGLSPNDGARWSGPDRALLDYVAALAAGRAAEAGSTVEEPDLERIAGLVNDAADRFERALVGAGPARAELRLRAAYGLGTVLAEAGERQIQRAQSTAMLTPQQVPYGPDTPERAVLDEAAATFERARTGLLERLELDWRDEDTRANLEWVQRRLAEIDAVRDRADEEQERLDQEQKDQEEEQEQSDQKDDQADDGGDPQDGDQSEDGSQQDGDQSQSEGQQDGDQDDAEPQDGEQQDGDQQDGDEQNADPNDPSDAGADPSDADDESADESAQDGELEDGEVESGGDEEALEPTDAAGTPVDMTDVEVRRLLQRLAEIEAQGEATRRRMAATQRRRVARDW
ncbi:hypothetical protein Pla163_25940 [Planctomycetes bacterium Pla163]|uniref:Uncharacterized protein n=1 Tax=Rohdeia mirabilis TaxID=2528008 RepID=A0A518D1V0_9BACT|nr:hypothetical protein Pla163_25940 [Planctomycetes bacterium Pla163]